MSIVRALIKFKGDVRAAADYILAGAPLEPPEYVFEGRLFYPLLVTDFGYEAMANGSDSIQDGATFILKEDLGDFNAYYISHVPFEEDAGNAGNIEKLVHTYVEGTAPAEVSLIVPPLAEVRDTNTDVVDFLEFKPNGIKPGAEGRFFFSFDVVREDRRKQMEKGVYMTLNTAQLYLERRATEQKDWLLPGLLARLIAKEKQDDWSKNLRYWQELQDFSQRNYVTFGKAPEQWSGRYFVHGQQFEFKDENLYAVYKSLRDRATIYNQSPKYLLFQMVENSVDVLFPDIETNSERRIELNSILDAIIEEEGSTFPLKSFIGPEAYKVLHQEELGRRNYVKFGSDPKLWSGEYFVDGEQITFTDQRLYSTTKKIGSTDKKLDSVYESLKARTTTPARLLFQMVQNSVDDLFRGDKLSSQQQARLSELNIILNLIIKEEGLTFPLKDFIDDEAYKILNQRRG